LIHRRTDSDHHAENPEMDSGLMRVLAICFSTTLAGLLVGCGSGEDPHPATVSVQGKVTYQGQPVPKGTITFQPAGGRPAVGEIKPDGTYRLSTFGEMDGAIPGAHKVMILANTGDPTKMPSSPGYVVPKDLVPRKYASPETSGLEVNVSKDKASYDFDLK
jgi:hypothetical protein